MQTALVLLSCSLLTLVIIAGVFRVEDAKGGKLVVLRKVREFFNRTVTRVAVKLSSVETYIGKGSLRLSLHYVLHGILHFVLSFVSRVQHKIEHLLRRNKQVAKEIRTDKEKTHLDKISDHKEEVALTEAQKVKLRSHG